MNGSFVLFCLINFLEMHLLLFLFTIIERISINLYLFFYYYFKLAQVIHRDEI